MLLSETSRALDTLRQCVDTANGTECAKQLATYCHDSVTPAMRALRSPIDRLELLVDKDIWPVPTYGDLMFEV